MPTRHLTDAQRQGFARFDGEPSADQLARYFHLDQTDRDLIGALRGDHNRLGFAVMLTSVRFLGAFPVSAAEIPASVLAIVIEQLDLEPTTGVHAYFEGSRRIRHLALIRSHCGFTDFGDNAVARFRLTRWLYALCWSGDDRPAPLIDRAAAWLIANKVLLPGVTVVERLVGRIRDRARTRLWRNLVASLSDDQRARIAALFDEGDTSTFVALDALRTIPSKRMPTELYRHLDRLDTVRAFNLRPSPPRGVPATSLERLARVARVGKPSAIAVLQEPRRTATIAALFHTLEAAAQDDAAELAEALLADMVKGAEAADKQARLRSLRDLDGAAMLLHRVGLLVLTDDALPLSEWRDMLFEQLPRPDIEAAMAKVEAIARPIDTKPYDQLRTKWRSARRLFRDVVTRIETDAAPGGKAVKAAISYLKGVDDWSSLARMRGAPTGTTSSIMTAGCRTRKPMSSRSSMRGVSRSSVATCSPRRASDTAIPGAGCSRARAGTRPG
jgi:hypothetical protein